MREGWIWCTSPFTILSQNITSSEVKMAGIYYPMKSRASERREVFGLKRERFFVQLPVRMALYTKLLRTYMQYCILCQSFDMLLNNSFHNLIKHISLIHSCLRGRLLEVNDRLLTEPWLLHQKVCFFPIEYYLIMMIALICSLERMVLSVCLSPKSPMWWTSRSHCSHPRSTCIISRRERSNRQNRSRKRPLEKTTPSFSHFICVVLFACFIHSYVEQ